MRAGLGRAVPPAAHFSMHGLLGVAPGIYPSAMSGIPAHGGRRRAILRRDITARMLASALGSPFRLHSGMGHLAFVLGSGVQSNLPPDPTYLAFTVPNRDLPVGPPGTRFTAVDGGPFCGGASRYEPFLFLLINASGDCCTCGFI